MMATDTLTDTLDEVAIDLSAPRLRERPARDLAGMPLFGLGLVALLGDIKLVLMGKIGSGTDDHLLVDIGSVLIMLGGVALGGLTTVAPGQARVVQIFGRYGGTSRTSERRGVIADG